MGLDVLETLKMSFFGKMEIFVPDLRGRTIHL